MSTLIRLFAPAGDQVASFRVDSPVVLEPGHPITVIDEANNMSRWTIEQILDQVIRFDGHRLPASVTISVLVTPADGRS